MFKKKKCSKCRSRINNKYDFCPYCGNIVNDIQDNEFGMLGKNDFMPSMNEINLPMGFNALFNTLMKNMNRQFSELENDDFGKNKKDGISISISTFGNGPPRISVNPLGNSQKTQETAVKVKQNLFSKEKINKFSNLPREEPKTEIRRLSNRVVYELEMPDVKSLEDVSVVRLESSIEIKAIGKNKAYSKLIPINLPLKGYNLSEGKLILELGVRN